MEPSAYVTVIGPLVLPARAPRKASSRPVPLIAMFWLFAATLSGSPGAALGQRKVTPLYVRLAPGRAPAAASCARS